MLRILPALAVFALGLPATASAAPFGELPFAPLKERTFCVQATGTPGELVRQTETTAPFLTAGPAGLLDGGVLPTDGAADCAKVASWAGGGGVLAFPVRSEADGERWIRAFVREPGQGWGEPIDILPPEPDFDAMSFTVAASARGDALVVRNSRNGRGRGKVTATRRLPGGAFGAPELLAADRRIRIYSADVRAGYGASGEAVVTWTVPGAKKRDMFELWAAIAPPGAPFATPQRIAAIDEATPYALAVAPDGRALAVLQSERRLVASERPPGGAFGPPTVMARTTDRLGTSPVAVLRAGGGAVVAWTSSLTAGLTARTREQPGPFGRAIEVVSPKRVEPEAVMVQQRSLMLQRPDYARAIATADGRVMVTWGHLTRRQGIWRVVPGVAVLGFSGLEYEVYGLAGGLREITEITPVALPDGTNAVVWTDYDAGAEHGRIHIARDGAPDAAEPAAPKVTVAPVSRAIRETHPLVLRVTCAAACDVSAQLAGQPAVSTSVTLTAAGSRRLALNPVDAPIVPRGGGKVRVLVRSSAPGAHRVTARTLTLNLRRPKIVFPPRVRDLTVARDGDDLLVRWRTAKPASPRGYAVIASDDRDEPVGSNNPRGRGRRTSFTVRIRNARKATKVTVYAIARNADKYRRTTVEVPR